VSNGGAVLEAPRAPDVDHSDWEVKMKIGADNNMFAGGVGTPDTYRLSCRFALPLEVGPLEAAVTRLVDVDGPLGTALARLLDDLAALGRDQDDQVARQTAVVRFLQAVAVAAGPASEQVVNRFAYEFALHAEALASMSAAQLNHRVIRRFDRALAAAAVQAAHKRLGWSRRKAGEHVARLARVFWKKTVGWRDTLQREKPTTFAELQEQLRAVLERVPKARARQRKDVAFYTEALRLAEGDNEAGLLARIQAWCCAEPSKT
jgi:hypothetical protein